MYAITRIRPGYWIIRNTYGERVAEAETLRQAQWLVALMTR